jgi:hypothetical protein
VVKGQTNAREGDRHTQSKRQDDTHSGALTQDYQTFGYGMPHHGGHIPS